MPQSSAPFALVRARCSWRSRLPSRCSPATSSPCTSSSESPRSGRSAGRRCLALPRPCRRGGRGRARAAASRRSSSFRAPGSPIGRPVPGAYRSPPSTTSRDACSTRQVAEVAARRSVRGELRRRVRRARSDVLRRRRRPGAGARRPRRRPARPAAAVRDASDCSWPPRRGRTRRRAPEPACSEPPSRYFQPSISSAYRRARCWLSTSRSPCCGSASTRSPPAASAAGRSPLPERRPASPSSCAGAGAFARPSGAVFAVWIGATLLVGAAAAAPLRRPAFARAAAVLAAAVLELGTLGAHFPLRRPNHRAAGDGAVGPAARFLADRPERAHVDRSGAARRPLVPRPQSSLEHEHARWHPHTRRVRRRARRDAALGRGHGEPRPPLPSASIS